MKKNKFFQATLISAAILIVGCSKSSTDTTVALSEDSSASGAAASSVGGAVSSSSSGGSLTMNQRPGSIWNLVQPPALAANVCPTIKTAAGAGCTQVSANVIGLGYSTCSFGMSTATWTGNLEVTLSPASAVTCGTFPAPVSASLQRQFVSAPGTPGTASRTSASGTVVVIDNQAANLGNFDTQTIAANIGTGYGSAVAFNGAGVRTGVTVKQRVYVTGGFDHSVVGSVSISESGTTKTASGSVTVYHNKLKVIGTSTFTNVTYNNTSCVPVSGTISTAFAAGTNVAPTAFGAAVVGKTETITFNADGTATLADAGGTSSTVKMSHCF